VARLIYNNDWEKPAASSKLAKGIGKESGYNLKTSAKKWVEKSIKFLFSVKKIEIITGHNA